MRKGWWLRALKNSQPIPWLVVALEVVHAWSEAFVLAYPALSQE
jgi:hypothetical protein